MPPIRQTITDALALAGVIAALAITVAGYANSLPDTPIYDREVTLEHWEDPVATGSIKPKGSRASPAREVRAEAIDDPAVKTVVSEPTKPWTDPPRRPVQSRGD